MYCTGDPLPKTVTGQAYSKLGKDMEDYAYINMWAGPPNYEGTYDVEDFVTGMVRTEGPTISLNGAWAQNIGEKEMFIDFLGDKGGIRLEYGADFTFYGAKDGVLLETKPKYNMGKMFENEINGFIHAVQTGERQPSHIDTAIITAQIMQALYDSSDSSKEINLS